MLKLNEINIILGSNFDFTAGFGPNQVITQFGLAIFILFTFLIKNIIIINSFFITYYYSFSLLKVFYHFQEVE